MAKFIPYTFTKKDVIGYFKNDKQYENWIAGQVRSKKIVKVRNGLYVQVDVSGYPLTTKFELATKIAEDACVCYHSAFEYFGVANQVFNTVTVGSKKRFNDFTFDDIDYVRKPLKHDVQIMNVVTAAVRVTSLERNLHRKQRDGQRAVSRHGCGKSRHGVEDKGAAETNRLS